MFQKYRKKPVVISAVQVTETNGRAIVDIINNSDGSCYLYQQGQSFLPTVRINTLEGVMEGRVGDYIIRGIAGEFYPCKASIFQLTYEVVDDQSIS